jgi:hypothetical protein
VKIRSVRFVHYLGIALTCVTMATCVFAVTLIVIVRSVALCVKKMAQYTMQGVTIGMKLAMLLSLKKYVQVCLKGNGMLNVNVAAKKK